MSGELPPRPFAAPSTRPSPGSFLPKSSRLIGSPDPIPSPSPRKPVPAANARQTRRQPRGRVSACATVWATVAGSRHQPADDLRAPQRINRRLHQLAPPRIKIPPLPFPSTRVNQTGRSNRSSPVSVWAGDKPAQIQNLNLNSKK